MPNSGHRKHIQPSCDTRNEFVLREEITWLIKLGEKKNFHTGMVFITHTLMLNLQIEIM